MLTTRGAIMNTFTNTNEFTQTANEILANCTLIKQENCIIVDDVLYEYVEDMNAYRFFFNDDDYDYLSDNDSMLEKLNHHLNLKAQLAA